MITTVSIAMSGLLSARNRAEVSSSNIVNATVAGRRDLPPEPSNTLKAQKAYTPQRAVDRSARFGGVITDRQPITPAFLPQYQPDAPYADKDGFVNTPNVSYAEEMVQMKIAAQAYRANAAVIEAADSMLGSLLDGKE